MAESTTFADSSDALLAAIVETSSDAILSKTLDGIITSWNAGAERIYGYSRQEAVGQSIRLIAPEERWSEIDAILQSLREGEALSHFETVRRRKDGQRIFVSLNVSPILGPDGTIVGASTIARDITEQKRVEQILHTSQEQLELAIVGSNGGLWDLRFGPDDDEDELPNEMFLSPRLRERLELGVDFPNSLSAWFDRVVPEDRPKLRQALLEHLHGAREHHNVEYRLRDGRGKIRRLLGRGKIARDENGRPRRWTGIEWDVTAQRRAEEMRSYLAAIVASSTDAIIGLAADAKIVSWNLGAARMFGYDEQEMLEQPVAMLTPPDRRDEDEIFRLAVEEKRRTEGLETVRLTRDGRRLEVSLSISPVLEPSGGVIGASVIARDISHSKRDQARRTAFLALLGHELRNPLAALSSALGMLDRSRPSQADFRQSVGIMRRQLDHMTRLVGDLVDLSRITRGRIELKRRPVELARLVASACRSHRPLVEEEERRLTVATGEEEIWVLADPHRLEQVIGNLLSNARKYTNAAGRVEVSVERTGEQALISVRDDGLGMSAEFLPQIFQMFRRSTQAEVRARSGLGIGLTLVKELVDGHGGEIEPRSDGYGRGSEFVVRLPTISPPAARLRREGSEPASARRRILLVEDNQDAAAALSRLLKIWGHEVVTVHDGFDALRQAAAEPPELVLLDIDLPSISGWEVAERLRGDPRFDDAVLVALTGMGQPDDLERSQRMGFDHHLVKPIRPKTLQRFLADLGPREEKRPAPGTAGRGSESGARDRD